jgi:YesN/AraC family two-component response regulator
MYRVVLVDDEALILRGLSTVIPWKEMGCEVVGTATNGRLGLELIRKMKPDILFTDIRMPNMDGLTMLAALSSEFPRMQTAVLTAYRDFDYARRAITLGVCRYLLKPSDLNELKETLRIMVSRLDLLPVAEDRPAGDAPEAGSSESDNPEANNSEAGNPEAGNLEAGHFIVNAALDYMRENCMQQHLSLSTVADHVYVSQWHLSKLLNRETGKSFFDLLGSMRIEKAKSLLRTPGMNIQDVAEQTGYTDVAHFSRTFKKLTGQTPGEYRKGR